MEISFRLQPCFVCNYQIEIHIPERHVLPTHKSHETVERGVIGLNGSYFSQILQAILLLPA